jgi:hypothetical protein
MLSEIGSNFWLSPHEMKRDFSPITPNVFNMQGSDYVWLSTGRSALSFVITAIERRNPKIKKIALIPSFTCHTVAVPFRKMGYSLHTFQISNDLTSNITDILEAQERTGASIILLHRYFGFDTLLDFSTLISILNKREVVLIEDVTQCIYSRFPHSGADYQIGSIRKWNSVPDGGFAVCKNGHFTDKPTIQDYEFLRVKVEASYQKYYYLFENKGTKQEFLSKFSKAEEMLEKQESFFMISDLSMQIQSNQDTTQLVTRRRNNYKQLASSIINIGEIRLLFPELQENVTPLFLPIYVSKRNQLQRLLCKDLIYAPIIWPKVLQDLSVCDQAEEFYEHLLCLPIDQRYDELDMEKILVAINKSITKL